MGRVIGEDEVLSFFSLGQRLGLGIGGIKARGAQKGAGDHEPWYDAKKDIDKNTLWVVQGLADPWLHSLALDAYDASWVAGDAPGEGTYGSKTRYRQADAPCALAAGANGAFHLGLPQ